MGKIHQRYVLSALTIVCFIVVTGVIQAQNITLEVMHRWSGDRHPMLREVLDRFEQAHPGVTVVDYQVGSELNAKLTTNWLGGVGPDIAMVNLNSGKSFGTGGILAPLNEFVENDGDALRAKMYPNMWDSIVWDGTMYYLPMTMNVGRHLLYYNTTLFAEAGLDPQTPPKTHSLWLDAARKLSRSDGHGGLIQRGVDLVTTSNSRNYDLAQMLTEQWGVSFFNPEGTAVLTDVATPARVMNWIVDFHQQQGGELPSGASDGRGHFQDGSVAMYAGIDGDWFIFSEANPDLDMALTTVPAPDGEPLRTIAVAGWGWGLSSQTEHPELAWELLKWLAVEPEGGGWFIQQQGRMSTNPEVNLDPAYLDVHPYWTVLGEVANHGMPGPQRCLEVSAGDANTLIGGALTRAARGEADPQSALLEAQRVLQPKCEQS